MNRKQKRAKEAKKPNKITKGDLKKNEKEILAEIAGCDREITRLQTQKTILNGCLMAVGKMQSDYFQESLK